MSRINHVHAASTRIDNLEVRSAPISGEPADGFVALVDEHGVESGVWTCTPGVFDAAWNGRWEVFHVLAGAGRLVEPDGTIHPIEPGVLVHLRSGARGRWEITETVVKAYVVVEEVA